MYFCYKFFTYIFFPFAPIYLYLRKLRKKEDDFSYKEKLSIIKEKENNDFLIWIHVASVGEAMSVLPLIENFAQDKKIQKILITSITLSSGKILRKKFNQNKKIIHQFLPLDIPFFIKRFLTHWKPKTSIFIDSEIWPNLIFQINKKKIPLLLINARITKKTFTRWNFLSNFAKKIFGKFDLCIASNKESENYLNILGAKKIINLGNLKYSGVKNNQEVKLEPIVLEKIENRKIWCAASTHQNEEIICAESHLKIKKNLTNILTIIIPRHIDRIGKIREELSKLGLKVSLYSRVDQISSNTDVLLVDSYGEALKFFNISKCVFLGKSLIPSLIMDSGQNPIEPAKQGCKIFHGPNVSNFAEIYNYLKQMGVTKQTNNSDELSLSVVEELKDNKVKNLEIAEKIENYGQNILNNVIIELKKYI